MPRAGRTVPKHILKLRGSENANYREELGELVSELPEPPAYLKPNAQAMFLRVCEYLKGMGTLARSDGEVIARYAAIWDRWQTAEEELAKLDCGYVEVLGKDGSIRFSRPNRWMTQARDACEQLRMLEHVLGLTPADRARLGCGAVKVVADPMAALLAKSKAEG